MESAQQRSITVRDARQKDAPALLELVRALIAQAAKAMGRTFVWWTARDWNDEARSLYDALGAICEPVTAHAVIFDDFEALAEEGRCQPITPSSNRSSSSSEAVGQKRSR